MEYEVLDPFSPFFSGLKPAHVPFKTTIYCVKRIFSDTAVDVSVVFRRIFYILMACLYCFRMGTFTDSLIPKVTHGYSAWVVKLSIHSSESIKLKGGLLIADRFLVIYCNLKGRRFIVMRNLSNRTTTTIARTPCEAVTLRF